MLTGHVYQIDVTLLKGKKHAEYQPRIELLKERLLILKSASFGKLTLIADSWFSDKKLFSWLNENDFTFEIEIKTNRKTAFSGGVRTLPGPNRLQAASFAYLDLRFGSNLIVFGIILIG